MTVPKHIRVSRLCEQGRVNAKGFITLSASVFALVVLEPSIFASRIVNIGVDPTQNREL